MSFPSTRHILTGLCLGMALALPLAGCNGQLPNAADQLNNEVVDRPPLSPQQLTEKINTYKIPENVHIDVTVYASLDDQGNTFDINQSADIAGITTHRMVNSRFPTEENISEYYTEAQKDGTRTWKRSITDVIDKDGNVTQSDDDNWHTDDKSDSVDKWRSIIQGIQDMTLDNNTKIENDLEGSAVTFTGEQADKILDSIRPMIETDENVTKALSGDYQMKNTTVLVDKDGRISQINVTMVPTDSNRAQTQINIVMNDIPEDVLELIHTPDNVKADANEETNTENTTETSSTTESNTN